MGFDDWAGLLNTTPKDDEWCRGLGGEAAAADEVDASDEGEFEFELVEWGEEIGAILEARFCWWCSLKKNFWFIKI